MVKLMKFKTGAGWTRAGYHHGSDTPTSIETNEVFTF